ncbi:unnamed protein product [Musa acuminata subsp. burmannicoides]
MKALYLLAPRLSAPFSSSSFISSPLLFKKQPSSMKSVHAVAFADVYRTERSTGGILLCGAQAQEQQRLARGSKSRHRFQKARTSQQNRRRAGDGGEVKEQPFLQRLPAEELRVDDVRIRDVFFRLI